MTTTHLVQFCDRIIETTITYHSSIADDWVRSIRSKHNGQKIIVGLDCKFRSHPIRSMSNKIATLQLCVETNCLIVQLFYLDYIPISLGNLLVDPDITFLGIEVYYNVLKLQKEYGINCRNKVDIRSLAKIWFPISCHRNPAGLKALAYGVAGLSTRKRKNSSECDWECRDLGDELIEYACVDAYALYRIGHELLKM
ncbi:unnamed protein product [Ilex paraguariensis]|uniref:3'-5' exonuclease domain-containing protein n=1 Tax=Ilex paraguariensis TaxID=185542 RepID=A0ABC8S7E2_9AQUA